MKKFTFKDIITLRDSSLQTVLRQTAYQTIVKALTTADTALRDKVFSNLSKPTAAQLKTGLEDAKGTSREESEKSQMRMVKTVVDFIWDDIEGEFAPPDLPGSKPARIARSLADDIEDACAGKRGHLYIYGTAEEKLQLRKALEIVENRRAELARLRSLYIPGDLLPVLLEFIEPGNIENLYVYYSNSDAHLPLLERLSGLKTLDIQYAKAIPESIGALKNLTSLSIGAALEHLPGNFALLQSLTRLSIKWKNDLSILAESVGELKNLTNLRLDLRNSFGSLEWLGKLRSLTKLFLHNCKGLKALPDSIGDLENLSSLEIYDSSFDQLPESITSLSALTEIHLYGNENLKALPDNIGNLENLQRLLIRNFYSLEKIPESIGNLKHLDYLTISSSPSLKALPESIGSLKNLKRLDLYEAISLERLPDSIVEAASLESLNLLGSSVFSVPQSVASLEGFTAAKRIAIIPREASVSYRSFVNHYFKLLETVARFNDKSRREGLLALEEEIDTLAHDIFRDGLRLAVDGTDAELIRRILAPKIEREPDFYRRKLMGIAAEAAACIRGFDSDYYRFTTPQLIFCLNFMIDLKDNPVDAAWEKYRYGDEDAFSAIDFSAAIQSEGEREEIRFARRAVEMSEVARHEGLLALESRLDAGDEQDVFEYGLSIIVNSGIGSGIIFDQQHGYFAAILDRMVERENDPVQKNIAAAKKVAVLSICAGDNPRIMLMKVSAYFHQSIADVITKELLED
ncbi:MAG: hypothetical protein FWB99_00025 [Treponema sp.]|nr:hypothetical protein [Treponema sp.]